MAEYLGRVVPEFFVGLDLGQAHDYTALAIAQVLESSQREYHLRHLQRYPLGTSYPAIVQDVAARLDREPLPSGETTLALDWTAVGRPLYDMFAQAKLQARLIPISIHGGNAPIRDGGGWSAPKRDLISVTQLLLQQQRLRIAPALPESATLTKELQDYRLKISATGHDSYDAREGAHDDLVLAVALACWVSEHGRPRRLRLLD